MKKAAPSEDWPPPVIEHQSLSTPMAPRVERGLVSGDSGATLVEIAVTLPVFFLLIFGLINFALVVFGYCNITYASRAAARYACLHSATSYPDTTVAQATTTSATATAVNTIAGQYIFGYPSNTYSSNVTYSGSGNFIGNTATVAISVTYSLSMPFFTYSGLTVSSSTSGTIIQ